MPSTFCRKTLSCRFTHAAPLGRKNLQRDEAIELEITGLVNDAHPAFAKALEDGVMEERFADHGERGL
jgi:hypothetical protein